MKPLNAVSYLRWSSAEQKEGHSKERQSIAPEICKRQGWKLVSTRIDDGVSAHHGRNVKKGELGKFLQEAESGAFGIPCVLIIEQFSRLTRMELDPAKQLVRDILKKGILIYVHYNNRLYEEASLNELAAMLELDAMLYLCWQESNNKSKMVKAAWAAKSKKEGRITKWCPGWIEPHGNGFRVIEEKADIVRQVYAMAESGLGIGAILRRLYKNGTPTVGKKATRWNERNVHFMLTTRNVLGEMTIMGQTKKEYYPPIIDPNQYDTVQAQLKSRQFTKGNQRKIPNLFTGVMYSLNDKCIMRVSARREGLKLVSRDALAGQTRLVSHHYKPLEEAFLQHVSELKPDDLLPRQTMRDDSARLRDRLIVVDDNLRLISDRLTKGKASQRLIESLDALEDEKRDIERQLTTGRAITPTQSLREVKSIKEQLQAASGETLVALRERLRSSIARLVDRIGIYIHYEVRKVVRSKSQTRCPKTEMTKVLGLVCIINFRGGGCRSFVIGEVPEGIRRRYLLKDKQTHKQIIYKFEMTERKPIAVPDSKPLTAKERKALFAELVKEA
jgi:DNA invertase Pin-like site-specific DNA recombinase